MTNDIIEGVDQGRYYVGSNGNIYDSYNNSYLRIYADRVGYCNVNLHTSNGTKANVIFDALGMTFSSKEEKESMRHKVDSIEEHKAYKDISKNYKF